MVAQFIADKCPLVHYITVATPAYKDVLELQAVAFQSQTNSSPLAASVFLVMSSGIPTTEQQFTTGTQCLLSNGQSQSQFNSSALSHNAFLVIDSGISITDK
jgi:hypothetical protein